MQNLISYFEDLNIDINCFLNRDKGGHDEKYYFRRLLQLKRKYESLEIKDISFDLRKIFIEKK